MHNMNRYSLFNCKHFFKQMDLSIRNFKINYCDWSVEEMKRTEDILNSCSEIGNVLLEKNNETGIAKITLSNQSRRNAISGHMMIRLREIVAELEEWKNGRICILRGENGHFCSGGDLNVIKKLVEIPSGGDHMCAYMHDVTQRFRQLPMLSIAVLEGSTLGGGAELSLSCDLRLMTKTANIGFVQGIMGLTPGWAGAGRLVQIVGYTKALEILLSAKIMDADLAFKYGLVDEILTSDGIENVDKELSDYVEINYLKKIDTSSFRRLKTLVYRLTEPNYLIEREIFSQAFGSDAMLKALENRPKHK